jgi:hypothetical protein
MFDKTKGFDNHDALVKYYAECPIRLIKVWSREAHGNLPDGETFDGFQREIALQKRILELEKMVSQAKRQK